MLLLNQTWSIIVKGEVFFDEQRTIVKSIAFIIDQAFVGSRLFFGGISRLWDYEFFDVINFYWHYRSQGTFM